MHNIHTKRSIKGFTLIEVMVVVAIVAIIAGVAWPLYTEQTIKNRRTEAVMALSRISNELQDHFSDNERYTGYVVRPSITASLSSYTIDFPELTDSTYLVTLTPTGPQVADDDCGELSMNHRGQKFYTGSAPTAARCFGSTN